MLPAIENWCQEFRISCRFEQLLAGQAATPFVFVAALYHFGFGGFGLVKTAFQGFQTVAQLAGANTMLMG